MSDTFPLYRKYPNEKSFFRITASDAFDELKIMGSRYMIYHVKASILPDRNFIADMINFEGGHWLECSEEEYIATEKECRETRILLQ